jgi:MoaA/NifB/PqqE/SkfB family radical SAM enzyme
MECPHLPRLKISEFMDRLVGGISRKRIPLQGSVELTDRCNLQCAHCYIKDFRRGDQSAAKELNRAEWERIIDQLVDEGCLWLLLTGGEPLLRQDFSDLYRYAKRKGLLVALFSNGTLLNRQIADYLAQWPPLLIEITLYGSTQEIYEAVTRTPGSYRRCMQAIELLLDRKLPLKLKTMALTLNQHDIPNLKAYARSIGVDFRFDASVNPRLDGAMEPTRFRLTPELAASLELSDEKRARALLEIGETLWGAPDKPEALYYCGAGLNTFHIDSCGALSVCMMCRQASWNLRHETFRKAWRQFIPVETSRLRQTRTRCQECELNCLCEQCPGWAELECGDPESPVEFLCKLARLRGDFVRDQRRGKRQGYDAVS